MVLVLIKGLGIGGAEKLISEGSALWDRSRFDYRVAYVLPWKNQLVPELVDRDISVRCLGGRRGNTFVAARKLHSLVQEWGVDLIHAHLPLTGIMARSTKAPVVYTEHNIVDSYRQPTQALNRATYFRNQAVIAVSDAVAASLAGYSAKRLQVIPNGVHVSVDADKVAEARAELALDPSRPVVLHIGNIRPHKGHSNLIAAAAELQAARPDVMVLSIGGEKHPGDLDRVRAEAAARGLNGSMQFLGRRSEALAIAAAADVYVNPADVEGLPVSILEAMALGLPVVATDVGGVSTVVRHQETGLLVDPQEPAALAAAILRLIDDRALARELGTAAKSLVEREYGLGTMVSSVERVYEAVLVG